MKTVFVRMAVLAGCCLCSLPGWAMSFESAYQATLAHAPELAAQKAAWQAQQAQVRSSQGQLYPQLSFSGSVGKLKTTQSTTTGQRLSREYDTDARNWNFMLQQAVYRADIWHDLARQRQLNQAEKIRLEAVKRDLYPKVAQPYLNALKYQQLMQVQQQQIHSLDTLLEGLNKRYALGRSTLGEIQLVRAELADAQAQYDEFAAYFSANLKQLGVWTGSEFSKVDLEPMIARLQQVSQLLGKPVERLLHQLETHPRVLAAKAQVAAAEEAVQTRLAGHKPQLMLVASRRMSRSDSENTLGSEYQTTSVELRMHLPLYSGGTTSADVERARAQLRQAVAQLQMEKQQLSQQLIDLRAQLQAQYKHYLAAQTQARLQLERTNMMMQLKENGRADLTDWLKARKALQQRQQEVVKWGYSALATLIQVQSLLRTPPQANLN